MLTILVAIRINAYYPLGASTGVPRLSLMRPGLGLQICRARNSEAKTVRGVGIQLMSVLGDSIDTIRQQCAKFDSAPNPTT